MVTGRDGAAVTADRPDAAAARLGPPDPTQAKETADFVGALGRLRRWAGDPSLSRLRSLGGQTVTPDGVKIDALPKSTTSHVLRQADRLPRWDFVRAFVTACLRNCDYPDELIEGELERWRTARSALADAPAPAPGTSTSAPSGGGAPDPDVHEPVDSETDPEAIPVDPPAPDTAFDLLVRRVAREEERARKGLLGGHSIAPVSFGARPRSADGDARDDGGDAHDGLDSIGRFFDGLRPRRLLVVGESGAGKTVLAIELVLQLLEPLLTAAAPLADRPMAPVRLNAARWTPGRTFEAWLAEQLVQEFGLTATDATRLVRDRRVLPVVDGLDELDPHPSPDRPRRAMGLLAELNRYSDLSGRRPGPVVVTCRADRHAELSESRTGLAGATVIHLHDLTPEQIGAYLRARWPDGHPCRVHRDTLHAALSGASQEAVRATLATPWRLLLTVTAVESGADPADLLHADPGADPEQAAELITRRLLTAYVPAATALTPRSAHRTPYDPDQVRTWLQHLAAHLRWQAARTTGAGQAGRRPPPGLTAIDLVPHLLWPIGGRRRVRALHCLCSVLLAVVAMLAFWTGSSIDRLGDLRDGLDAGQVLTAAFATGWVGIAAALSLSPWPAASAPTSPSGDG
jgi:hypothetical protein